MATITAPATTRRSGTHTSPLAHVDVLLLTLPIAISALGLLMIYDSSRAATANAGLSRLYYVQRQGVAMLVGLLAMTLVMSIDFRRIRDAWGLLYLAMLPLLGGVLVLGSSHKGAQAWFQIGPMQFQPSEVAKLVLIIAIAGYCHQHRGDLDPWRIAVVVGLTGIVMAVVYAQNDLGTMLVIMVCAAAMLVVAGLKPVHLAVLLALSATLVAAAVVTDQVENYQIDRFTKFADQSTEGIKTADLTPAQLNLRASKGAIVAGGLTGDGLGEGRLTKNGFVPEQHTDFIFSAVGEDLGFVGGATLLLLYALLAWRLWRIALLASDSFGTLVAIGVLALFSIHVFENVGMSMGIMPITGIPLPFMSYGGSAIIASFMAIGLVLNVHMRRFT
jgi:rod shape determining protein RodA